MNTRKYTIHDLGFHQNIINQEQEDQGQKFEIGRVLIEHKERYVVYTNQGELDCELIGNLRFSANSRQDFPAVGDWVSVQIYDTNKGLIHSIYPRQNILERQAINRYGEKQIIATNIDFGIIVQSVNRDFSFNRLERYITLCHSSNIQPMIVLNKIDLITGDEVKKYVLEIESRIKGIVTIPLSNLTGQGLNFLKSKVQSGKTYCLLGSSGVGKSTLINSLANTSFMKTGDISKTIDRGKHITSHRELVVLDSGGIIIDNPGMREVGITENESGLIDTFDEIYRRSKDCKFNDCKHENQKGCAILKAIETGDLPIETYENFMKLQREQVHFSNTIYEKRKKDKAFGKLVKQVMKNKHSQR